MFEEKPVTVTAGTEMAWVARSLHNLDRDRVELITVSVPSAGWVWAGCSLIRNEGSSFKFG